MGGTLRNKRLWLALDSLTQLLPAPDIMKIDVEGAETEFCWVQPTSSSQSAP